MRLIDADALLNNYKGNILTAQTDYAQGARNIIDDIRNAPTIDAIPVVRCKNCVYCDKRTCYLWGEIGIRVSEDGYCSYGERYENE